MIKLCVTLLGLLLVGCGNGEMPQPPSNQGLPSPTTCPTGTHYVPKGWPGCQPDGTSTMAPEEFP